MDRERSSEEGDLPLHDEAKAREKWRGGETRVDEGDDARIASKSSADGRPGKGGPGTIPPPD